MKPTLLLLSLVAIALLSSAERAGALRRCCQAMTASCLACHESNRQELLKRGVGDEMEDEESGGFSVEGFRQLRRLRPAHNNAQWGDEEWEDAYYLKKAREKRQKARKPKKGLRRLRKYFMAIVRLFVMR